MIVEKGIDTKCHHCGDLCQGEVPVQDDHAFCCHGCLLVWNLIHENGLSDYYNVENTPGLSLKYKNEKKFDFLESEEISAQLISFYSGPLRTVYLDLPQIHCTACVWLLERLNQFKVGIKQSQVNYLKKQVTLIYDSTEISLKEVVLLLASLGYPPNLSLTSLDTKGAEKKDRSLIYKIGLAGFCFGNIMLLSFPDYLGFTAPSFSYFFAILQIILSIPIIAYAGRDYITSAIQSARLGRVGIDLPIAIGMLTLFFRSIYDIFFIGQEGYLDSLSGFVFFLLIGRWIQSRTFSNISFDRDFKSFLPISVKCKNEGDWQNRTIDKIQKGDLIMIRNSEIIPCDGILTKGKGKIDYSFVTGEERPVDVQKGDSVYSGGKLLNTYIEVEVTRSVNQSQLTQLWNDDIFNKRNIEEESQLLNVIGKYFTIAILIIASGTLFYWLGKSSTMAINSFTSVLIIACPCVLALSVPFIFGSALRWLSKISIYCRNVYTLFDLHKIDTIVFDKTGTLTDSDELSVSYSGITLSGFEKRLVYTLTLSSIHKLSQAINKYEYSQKTFETEHFKEHSGLGIEAEINGHKVRLGSADFIFDTNEIPEEQTSFLEIDGKVVGRYTFKNTLRDNVEHVLTTLTEKYKLALLSGDNSSNQNRIRELFRNNEEVYFNQSPKQKLEYIKNLQKQGRKVLMIGDGLNDAGAIKQADVGMVISTNENNFTPASDIILSADQFEEIPGFLKSIRHLHFSLFGAFALALMYNLIGLAYAVSGELSPVVAAILMPISSISIMLYGLVMSRVSLKNLL